METAMNQPVFNPVSIVFLTAFFVFAGLLEPWLFVAAAATFLLWAGLFLRWAVTGR